MLLVQSLKQRPVRRAVTYGPRVDPGRYETEPRCDVTSLERATKGCVYVGMVGRHSQEPLALPNRSELFARDAREVQEELTVPAIGVFDLATFSQLLVCVCLNRLEQLEPRAARRALLDDDEALVHERRQTLHDIGL